jgi:hypothetical protein
MIRVVAFAASLAIASVNLAAQSHPDLAGDWVLDQTKTAAVADAKTGSAPGASGGGAAVGGGGMMGPGAAVTVEYQITVAVATMTVERLGLPTPQKYTYTLDGSESVNTVGTATTHTKSHWVGATLVTEGTRSFPTSQGTFRISTRDVRSLDTDGAMVVEMTTHIEGQPATTTYQVFVKKSKN